MGSTRCANRSLLRASVGPYGPRPVWKNRVFLQLLATFGVFWVGSEHLGVCKAYAAESDPYYAWLRAPRDTSTPLNARINQKFERALTELNQLGWANRLTCAEVANVMVWPLWGTAMWYFVGGMNDLDLTPVPSTNTELREQYMPHSIYQHSRFWKWGFIVPPDPTIVVDGINLSTDKLGHFFHEGREYYSIWQAAERSGHSSQEAHEIAIWSGIRDENMIQGDVISGIFSYADLEANEQGFRFFQRLCAEQEPWLIRGDEGWRLIRPFDIRDWVNPCWDESFYPSAFTPRVGEGVQKALRFYCPLRAQPDVRAQRERYRATGCDSFSYYYLEELRLGGWIPDNAPYDIDDVCAAMGDLPAPLQTEGKASPRGSVTRRTLPITKAPPD